MQMPKNTTNEKQKQLCSKPTNTQIQQENSTQLTKVNVTHATNDTRYTILTSPDVLV